MTLPDVLIALTACERRGNTLEVAEQARLCVPFFLPARQPGASVSEAKIR